MHVPWQIKAFLQKYQPQRIAEEIQSSAAPEIDRPAGWDYIRRSFSDFHQ
jgi:hypothetical protein